jgi:Fe-S oxidoreductase
MATYKSEFLSHYYEGRLRPRSAYAFGLIHWWSRLASRLPGLANLFTQAPLLSHLTKWIVHMAPERKFPAFAAETFRSWYRKRARVPVGEAKQKVILWADTFNNHFHSETLKAGVEVLEAAGFQVEVPQGPLCCGRPLYDFGMLDQAQKQLRQILAALRSQIRAGIPVVVLEPSCASVFRDELTNLFPDDADAQRLKQQTFTFGEFLHTQAAGYEPPKLQGKAIVHGHCHHKAIMRLDSEESILNQMGLDFQMPDFGCCGMGGSFGFERGEQYA